MGRRLGLRILAVSRRHWVSLGGWFIGKRWALLPTEGKLGVTEESKQVFADTISTRVSSKQLEITAVLSTPMPACHPSPTRTAQNQSE